MRWYSVFSQIVNMSLTGGIVILVVAAARLCLKRAPKAVSYGLWAVVLFRLLCPLAVSSDFSLLNLLDVPVKEALVGSRLEYILIEGEPVGNLPGTDNGVASDVDSEGDLGENLLMTGINSAINVDDRQKNDIFSERPVTVTVERPLSAGTIFPAAVIWCLGAAGMLLYAVLSGRRLRRNLVGAVHLKDNIFLSDYITSPFVMGLWRPRIYLPSDLGAREQSYILLHEQYHIRRLDHVAKVLGFAVLCIHWFNPLVWLAFVLFCRDMEMSCDEAVVKGMGEEVRADYSASLLELATGKREIGMMPLAFGEGDPGRRIRNLARWKRPALGAVAVAAVFCVILAVALLTNPREQPAETEERPRSLTCNIQCQGINADIDPSYFPEGFDFNYGGLMRGVILGDGTLTFTTGWDTDELVVGENYYEKHTVGTIVKQETYRLKPDEEGRYTLHVSHRKPQKEEQAFYFIRGENGTYVLEIQFPAEEQMTERKEDEILEGLCVLSTDEGVVYSTLTNTIVLEPDSNEDFFHNFYQ